MNGVFETGFFFLGTALAAFYAIALVILRAGLRTLAAREEQKGKADFSVNLPSISVIVAARNEEQNLGWLVPSLVAQDYPHEKLEVILVDDRSEDATWDAVQSAAQAYPFVKALRVTDLLPDFAPKKRALDLAIRTARGEILLLTDADCTPPPTWAKAMVGFYQDGVAGVVGYSPYRFDVPTPTLLKGMLALDYLSIFAVAAASAGLGRALTASGTNFSYRKSVYVSIGGFESMKQWISGDDDLLLHEATRKKAGKFLFALDSRAFVPAAAPTSSRQFWNQRIRFASKGKHYSTAMTASLTGVYLVNLAIVVGIVGLLFGQTTLFGIAALLWVVKSMAEWSFLSRAAKLFHEQRLLKFFLPTALFHPFYITFFGFLGLFGNFRWKE